VTTREPLYTDADRAELLALAVYRSTLCPVCGGPIKECTAPEKSGPRFRAKRERCQRGEALAIAHAHAVENNVRYPESLIWRTEQIPGR
jgi:hypothetical protein